MTVKGKVPSRYPEDRLLAEDLGRWWVLHTKPNCERQVATYLLYRGISYYLPLYHKRSRFGNLGRFRTTETPLFNGYLCIALDRHEHNLLYDSKKFVRIIKVDDQETFVRELQGISRAVEMEEDLRVQHGLLPGKKVLILDGPLAGTEGVVVRRRGERQLGLSVKMFNQTVLVKLDPLTKVEVL
jgi:transcriptional antiterminator RfaH